MEYEVSAYHNLGKFLGRRIREYSWRDPLRFACPLHTSVHRLWLSTFVFYEWVLRQLHLSLGLHSSSCQVDGRMVARRDYFVAIP